jgi:hypothetical protein
MERQLESPSIAPLVRQKPALAMETAAVSGERSIRPDYPVTRNHDGHGIRAVGQADCPHRGAVSDSARELAIRQRLAAPDLPQRGPHRALKLRAFEDDRQAVDGRQVTGEIRAQRGGQSARIRCATRGGSGAIGAELPLHAGVAVVPARRVEAPLFVSHQREKAERGLDLIVNEPKRFIRAHHGLTSFDSRVAVPSAAQRCCAA